MLRRSYLAAVNFAGFLVVRLCSSSIADATNPNQIEGEGSSQENISRRTLKQALTTGLPETNHCEFTPGNKLKVSVGIYRPFPARLLSHCESDESCTTPGFSFTSCTPSGNVHHLFGLLLQPVTSVTPRKNTRYTGFSRFSALLGYRTPSPYSGYPQTLSMSPKP